MALPLLGVANGVEPTNRRPPQFVPTPLSAVAEESDMPVRHCESMLSNQRRSTDSLLSVP